MLVDAVVCVLRLLGIEDDVGEVLDLDHILYHLVLVDLSLVQLLRVQGVQPFISYHNIPLIGV